MFDIIYINLRMKYLLTKCKLNLLYLVKFIVLQFLVHVFFECKGKGIKGLLLYKFGFKYYANALLFSLY